MYSQSSHTKSNRVEENILSWTFVLESGNNKETTIIEPMISTAEQAEQRALSEFLKQAYMNRGCSIDTYITDIGLNDDITVGGIPYLIKDILIKETPASIKVTLSGVRYELPQ